MPCCEYHDRLGSKLHAAEFTAGDCGSIKLKTVSQLLPGVGASAPAVVQDLEQAGIGAVAVYAPENGNNDILIGFGRPEFCCFECPTLLAKLGVEVEGQPPIPPSAPAVPECPIQLKHHPSFYSGMDGIP